MNRIFYLLYAVLAVSCSNNVAEVVNDFEGTLQPKYNMLQKEFKRFKLDSTTASKPRYMSLVYNDSTKNRELTFFNHYTHTIEFYNYDNSKYLKNVKFNKKGSDGILRPVGYHIMNKDSIYIYDMSQLELYLTNGKGQVLNKKSLIGNLNLRRDPWMYKYPQYHPSTVTPLLGIDEGLLIMGQFMEDIQDTLVNKFKYLSYVDNKFDQFKVRYTYPKELYGNNYIWGDPLFNQVFYDIVPTGHDKFKLVFSYPVSHNIYLSDGLKEQSIIKKYAGSNYAKTINSLDFKNYKSVPNNKFQENYMENDLYGAILYDKFRKVYYRFLRRALTKSKNTFNLNDKPIAVIIYDAKFNYLGETDLGLAKECHWENAFVTKEGLNIEWVDHKDIDEAYLNLKIFGLTKIKK